MERIGLQEKKYVNDILDNNLSYDIDKKYVNLFEKKFADTFNCKYGISAVNGTATMHAILEGMGIKDGDEVIVPALTMLSTCLSVLQTNALPVFADIDPDTFQISVESIKKCITPRTKAIQVVSLYGMPPEMDEIMELANKHNLYVIEDNAECYLGYYKNKIVGSIGHASSFSLQNSKHLTSGEGGMILTNDINLAHNIRRFTILGYQSIGELAPPNLTIQDFQHPNFHRHVSFGFNYRISGLQAAVGLGQLERIEELVNWRVKSGDRLKRIIEEKKCEWLIPQKTPSYIKHSYWTFVCKLNTKQISWYDFRNIFIKNGGEPFFASWIPCHLEQCMFKEKFKDYQWQKLTYGLCPNTENIQSSLIQFKTNYLSESEIDIQCKALSDTIDFINNDDKRKIFCLISCRLNSSRLQKKGIQKINGKESIIRCIDNINQTAGLHKTIVCTTLNKEDDELENILKKNNYECFRGSSDNVLKRLVDALEFNNAKDDDIMIRGMGDDICVSSEILDIMIADHKKKNCDVTYCYPEIYPNGVIGEVYNVGALRKLYKMLSFENTEYLTFYFACLSKSFNINVIKLPFHYECKWNLSLDYEYELNLFEEIYKSYPYQKYINFNMLKHFFKKKEIYDDRVVGLGNDWKKTLDMLNNQCKNLTNFEYCNSLTERLKNIYLEKENSKKDIEMQTYFGETIKVKADN